MKLEILGSGGSVTTPKIFCQCQSCMEARALGAKHTRLGPSVFIHGPDLLFDTPEEISIQINRSSITEIKACFYSHWHPDHTAGKRLFQAGEDWVNDPPQPTCTPVYFTEKIAETFELNLGIMSHLNFLEYKGFIKKNVIGNSEPVCINSYKIEPIQLAQDYVFAYKISNSEKSILVVMDELKDWKPSEEIRNIQFDLVFLPFGIFHYNPISKEKILPDDYFLFDEEQTIDETLEIIESLNAEQFILSHIEEPDNITIGLAESLEKFYSEKMGKNIRIAFDMMEVEV